MFGIINARDTWLNQLTLHIDPSEYRYASSAPTISLPLERLRRLRIVDTTERSAISDRIISSWQQYGDTHVDGRTNNSSTLPLRILYVSVPNVPGWCARLVQFSNLRVLHVDVSFELAVCNSNT